MFLEIVVLFTREVSFVLSKVILSVSLTIYKVKKFSVTLLHIKTRASYLVEMLNSNMTLSFSP